MVLASIIFSLLTVCLGKEREGSKFQQTIGLYSCPPPAETGFSFKLRVRPVIPTFNS